MALCPSLSPCSLLLSPSLLRCLSTSLSVSVSVFIYSYLSENSYKPSMCLYIPFVSLLLTCLYGCLSVSLFIYLSVYAWEYIYVCIWCLLSHFAVWHFHVSGFHAEQRSTLFFLTHNHVSRLLFTIRFAAFFIFSVEISLICDVFICFISMMVIACSFFS